MISQALVGIGIIGLEGSQAELASDYAIPRFRFLQRLLAVHGRYALYRNARCVCFSFYKNIALSLCQVYFAGFSAFSGATVFDSWLLAIKNTLFSFLPPFLIGCFGKDISEEILMDPKLGPQLYSQLRDGLYFDGAAVSSWFGVALLHGTVIFWVMVDTLQQDDTDPGGGKTTGLIQTGTYMMSMVVYVVLTKAAVHMHIITAIQVCGLLFSYVLYPSTLAAYSAIPSAEYEGAYDLLQDTAFYGLSQSLFSDPKHYLYIFISVIGLVSTFDFSILYLQRKIRPTLRDECADNYDYQDPPWNRSLPIFGCCGRSTAGVHPLSPLDRGRFEGLDVTPSGRGFGPSRHGDEDPNPFSVPNCSRSLSASSSSNLLASEPNLQTTPPGRSHERNMWPRTPPAIPNFKPLSSSITGVFTSNGTGGYKTGLPLHFGLPLVPATPPTNTPLSSTPPPTRPGSGSSSIIAAGPGSAAAMPHDASAIPPYRPPPAPFTRSVTSETYIPGRLRIKPLPTLRQADFSSLSPPVTPPPMLPRSQPVPPLGVRR
ncbi:putative phospholipid-transporting ATPase 4 [Diplonema papillatum]|nr:putative phospholipid-transporting ATPase 4 [Diplonema papillatum]